MSDYVAIFGGEPTHHSVDSTLSRRRLNEIVRLARRRHRNASGEFIVEGLRSVESAVEAGAELAEILVSPELSQVPRVQRFARRAGCPVHVISLREIERLSGTKTTQGILAVAVLRRCEVDQLAPPLLALDGVQDPGNVGALVRSAAWFGLASVLAGPGTADPFGPKAVRASMGGIWDLAIAETDDFAGSLTHFRERGLKIYGADLSGAKLSHWKPGEDSVLVIGSEAHGISEAVREFLDGSVRIGGGRSQGVESLNAAVAAGIMLHHWAERIGGKR